MKCKELQIHIYVQIYNRTKSLENEGLHHPVIRELTDFSAFVSHFRNFGTQKMPAPKRMKDTPKSSEQADADVDFEEQHEWDMYQEWLEKLDAWLWETGKKKTAQQIGEEISKMLENQRLELEMKQERQREEAIRSGVVPTKKEEPVEDPTAVIDEDELQPNIHKKSSDESQEIQKEEMQLLTPEQKVCQVNNISDLIAAIRKNYFP